MSHISAPDFVHVVLLITIVNSQLGTSVCDPASTRTPSVMLTGNTDSRGHCAPAHRSRHSTNGVDMQFLLNELVHATVTERVTTAANRRLAHNLASVRRWSRLAHWAEHRSTKAAARCESDSNLVPA